MSTPFRLKRSAVSGKRPGLSDLQRGELALNFYDGYLFAERDTGGVGIGTTISLLTPWTENFGGDSIYYSNSVGVGTATPRAKFDVDGSLNVTGISTFGNDVNLIGSTAGITSAYWDSSANTLNLLDDVRIHLGIGSDLQIYHDSATNSSYINESGSGRLEIRGSDLYLADEDGTNMLYAANNAGVSLYYGGGKRFETTGYGVSVYGGLSISGVTTYSDTTNNTLGDADTGAVQIDGGLGINKNVTIGENLYVGGYAEFVGVATFKGGTINLGDSNTDNIDVSGEFVSNLVPNDDDLYSLGITTQRWKDGYFSGIVTTTNLYVAGITTTILLDVGIGGTVITTTETGLVGINSSTPTTTLDVGGTINSSTDVTINGTSVLSTAENDAVALAIALG